MTFLSRSLSVLLVVLALAATACGVSATSVTAPTAAPLAVATPAPAAIATSVPVAPSATPVPTPTQAAVVAEREVVLAVSRKLANGEQDPYFTHSSLMVWESLVAVDGVLTPVPQLAESWEVSEDAMTWTFDLRPG